MAILATESALRRRGGFPTQPDDSTRTEWIWGVLIASLCLWCRTLAAQYIGSKAEGMAVVA
jgi:hypothetical protein